MQINFPKPNFGVQTKTYLFYKEGLAKTIYLACIFLCLDVKKNKIHQIFDHTQEQYQ